MPHRCPSGTGQGGVPGPAGPAAFQRLFVDQLGVPGGAPLALPIGSSTDIITRTVIVGANPLVGVDLVAELSGSAVNIDVPSNITIQLLDNGVLLQQRVFAFGFNDSESFTIIAGEAALAPGSHVFSLRVVVDEPWLINGASLRTELLPRTQIAVTP